MMFLLLRYLHFAVKTAHQKHLTKEDTAMVNKNVKRGYTKTNLKEPQMKIQKH